MSKHRNLKVILSILFIILILCLIFILGLVVGYSKLGTGDWHSVFEWITWQHILDFFS